MLRSTRFVHSTAVKPQRRSRPGLRWLLGLLLLSSLLTNGLPPSASPFTQIPAFAPGVAVVPRAAAADLPTGTPTPPATASPSPTTTYTPLPVPTTAPSLTPIPDIDYVDQGLAKERDDILTQVADLPVLTATITDTVISGETGGQVRSPDGAFTLGLRPGMVPTTDTIHLQLSVPTFPTGDPHATRDGYPLAFSYVLTATRGSDGARLENFDPAAVLIWNIDPAALATAGVHGFPLSIYTFDETAGAWQEVPSYWKPETNQLLVTTPHFSLYAAGDGFDAVDNYLPSVNGSEVDLQTGAATFQYPIALPPGPGGFTPQVNLSYNSTAVDRVDRTGQGPSSIGWGWTLSTNYVAAAEHHFPTSGYNPWTASIVVEGTNGDLVQGNDECWHTATENYTRVLYNPGSGTQSDDSWEAWDKDGTHYVFDQRAYTEDSDNSTDVTYRWMLHTATDPHGNVATYSYAYEDFHAGLAYTPPAYPNKSVAVYPYQITYGANLTGTQTAKIRVTFDIISRTIGITNDLSMNDLNSPFYQSYRIDKSPSSACNKRPTRSPSYGPIS